MTDAKQSMTDAKQSMRLYRVEEKLMELAKLEPVSGPYVLALIEISREAELFSAGFMMSLEAELRGWLRAYETEYEVVTERVAKFNFRGEHYIEEKKVLKMKEV